MHSPSEITLAGTSCFFIPTACGATVPLQVFPKSKHAKKSTSEEPLEERVRSVKVTRASRLGVLCGLTGESNKAISDFKAATSRPDIDKTSQTA